MNEARWPPLLLAALTAILLAEGVLRPRAPAEANGPRVPDPLHDAIPAIPRAKAGALGGMQVYLSAGHGYVSHSRGSGWQRPEIHGLLEDTWTARFVAEQLGPALERAGALVLTARERDRHAAFILSDDRDETGFRATSVQTRELTGEWAMAQPTLRARTALASASILAPEGRALWTLTAPSDEAPSAWHVYVTWTAGPDRDPAARYVVVHPGGSTEITVDQTRRGDTWFPLGEVWLEPGQTVTVRLEGSGRGLLSANAVRMGGGSMSVDDPRTGMVVHKPMWEIAALHHLLAAGAPSALFAVPGGGFGGDASARARWAEWAHAADEEAVYLSIHTDAGGGRGTTAFVHRACRDQATCLPSAWESRILADQVRERAIRAIRDRFDPTWVDRGTRVAGLAEVNNEVNPDMPAVLLEVGFHDDPLDAAQLARPELGEAVADALTAGIIRYRNGEEADLPPSPAADLHWTREGVHWRTSEPDPDHGHAAGWQVRSFVPGEGWTPPVFRLLPDATPAPGATRFEVIGVNAAGLGRPAWVVPEGAGESAGEAPAVSEGGLGARRR